MDYTYYEEDKLVSADLDLNKQLCVCGFLFNPEKNQVVLIKKNRPDFQKGLFNGVGGKVENGEFCIQAMEREFYEEAGVVITNWNYFCKLEGDNYIIFFYYAISDKFDSVYSVTDEEIYKLGIDFVREHCQVD